MIKSIRLNPEELINLNNNQIIEKCKKENTFGIFVNVICRNCGSLKILTNNQIAETCNIVEDCHYCK